MKAVLRHLYRSLNFVFMCECVCVCICVRGKKILHTEQFVMLVCNNKLHTKIMPLFFCVA